MKYKSEKQKLKEMADILTRHHLGKLPKCYYTYDPETKQAHIYAHNLLYGERKSICLKRDKEKDREAIERLKKP